ncbi:hypothetical protein LPJ56_002714 [Coemansia sp. RSA 2599]|nr:hypothetical protein LPJ56_002714 [Coemansia sp. RSA 2599]
MSSEQLSSTIDPTLLQSLAQQHINTSAQLSSFSQLQINPDSSIKNSHSHSYGDNFGTPFLHSAPMNDSNGTTAPININRAQGLGTGNQQQLAGSAASFGTDYDRSGIANSFQQHIQRQQFQQQQQQQNQNLFRSHLGSPTQNELFSPTQEDIDVSPAGSMPNNSISAMTSGALPTSIPVAYQGGQRVGANQMFRMQTFSNSPPILGQAFQSMSLPAHTDWFDGHMVQQQSIGSALDASSFTAQQQLGGSNGDGMSPQNQTLMSLMEDDGVGTQKSEILNYEKRRRRRESHNAVERRRRDNINDRIQELYTLLPEAMIDANTKPNKGIILKKSVEYIRHLQQALQSQGVRIHELETGMSGQASVQQHNQATSGLAAMLAGAAGMNQGRSSNDGNMMNTGL